MKHIMFDLETLGVSHKPVILSIGAVYFQPHTGELGPEFYTNVRPHGQQELGLKMDADTVLWWLGEGEEMNNARRALLERAHASTPSPGLEKALELLTIFMMENSDGEPPCVWANGVANDIVWLESAFAALGQPVMLWSHRSPRDVRTVYDLAGFDKKSFPWTPNQAHHALVDARDQARAVCHCHELLGLSRRAGVTPARPGPALVTTGGQLMGDLKPALETRDSGGVGPAT